MKRRDEVLVGLVLTAGVALAVAGTIWLSRGGLEKGYPLYAEFPWGEGLKRGQPVLLVGVAAGYVDDVELLPTGTVVTELRMTGDYKVPVGTVATVIPAGIFGDKAVALTPARPNPVSHQPGDTLPVGRPPPGIADITTRADSVAASMNAITRELEREMVMGRGIAQLRMALAGANRLIAELSNVASVQSRQLSATMTSLRTAVGAVDPVKIDSTLTGLQAASENTARVTAQLNETTARLNSALGKLDNGTGTAGLLLNDPALYHDMRRLVARLDSLTADVKKNPRRYINLEIF